MQALHVDELQEANTQLQRQLNKVTRESAHAVGELSQHLEEAESHVQQLLEAAQERDSAVLQLEKKARLFYEVVEHRSSIARILEVLEELSVSQEEDSPSEDSAGIEDKAVTATGTGVEEHEVDTGPQPTTLYCPYPTSPQGKNEHPQGDAGLRMLHGSNGQFDQVENSENNSD